MRRRRGKEENLGLELGMSVRGAKKKIFTHRIPPAPCVYCVGLSPGEFLPGVGGYVLSLEAYMEHLLSVQG